MKIGFIGAGKCGMSLAAYFKSRGIEISGFSSRSADTGEFHLLTPGELVKGSDIIFVTVTDRAIPKVWEKIKNFDLYGKIICHCSGSMTSDVFTDAPSAASVHPMLAFNSRFTDIDAISQAFFTIEGGNEAVKTVAKLLEKTGNRYKVIAGVCKAEYHAAACFASNFVVSVCEKAQQHLMNCGFSRDEAHKSLIPLMQNNMNNIISDGTMGAITGPAARGDMVTINKHLEVMGTDAELYKLLTKVILNMKDNGRA